MIPSLIVSAPYDRIQRTGGSVIVSATGAVIGTTVTDAAVTALAANQFAIVDQAGGPRTTLYSGRSRFDFMNVGGTNWAAIKAANGDFTGTLTVSGTGSHTFSGLLKVASASYDSFETYTSRADSAGLGVIRARRSNGAGKFVMENAGTSFDTIFYTQTGAAGSEVSTEALRIVNANGYVSVPTRLGIGTASPGAGLDSASNAWLRALVGMGSGSVGPDSSVSDVHTFGATASRTVFHARQTAASATVPVMVVKLGATPGAGGHALQFKDSADATLTYFDKDGVFWNKLATSYLMYVGSSPNNLLKAAADTHVSLVVRGYSATQSGDLFQAQDNSGNAQAKFDSAGHLTLLGPGGTTGGVLKLLGRAAAPVSVTAGHGWLWYDDTAGVLKYTNSAGTTKTVTAA